MANGISRSGLQPLLAGQGCSGPLMCVSSFLPVEERVFLRLLGRSTNKAICCHHVAVSMTVISDRALCLSPLNFGALRILSLFAIPNLELFAPFLAKYCKVKCFMSLPSAFISSTVFDPIREFNNWRISGRELTSRGMFTSIGGVVDKWMQFDGNWNFVKERVRFFEFDFTKPFNLADRVPEFFLHNENYPSAPSMDFFQRDQWLEADWLQCATLGRELPLSRRFISLQSLILYPVSPKIAAERRVWIAGLEAPLKSIHFTPVEFTRSVMTLRRPTCWLLEDNVIQVEWNHLNPGHQDDVCALLELLPANPETRHATCSEWNGGTYGCEYDVVIGEERLRSFWMSHGNFDLPLFHERNNFLHLKTLDISMQPVQWQQEFVEQYVQVPLRNLRCSKSDPLKFLDTSELRHLDIAEWLTEQDFVNLDSFKFPRLTALQISLHSEKALAFQCDLERELPIEMEWVHSFCLVYPNCEVSLTIFHRRGSFRHMRSGRNS